MLPNYFGIYRSVVSNVSDPANSGRVKVICPQISGNAETHWVEPINPQEPIPAMGSLVWVSFSGGDLTKPIYLSNSVIALPSPTVWTSPTLSTGWAFGSTVTANYQGLRYRIDTENNLVLAGAIHATVNTPTTNAFHVPYSLPKGYSNVLSSDTNTGTYKQTCSFYIEVTGQAFLNAPSAIATGDNFYIMMQIPMI